jgi:hypothetical protein
MSATLLQRVKNHIIDDGGLLSDYSLRYYRWTDADLNGSGSVALFRMTGTQGLIQTPAQFIDVSLHLLADPDAVKTADDDMLEVLQYLRADYSDTGVFNMFPPFGYTGPSYLQNNRALFEMVIRCGVEDH